MNEWMNELKKYRSTYFDLQTNSPVISNSGEIIAMSALGMPYSWKKEVMVIAATILGW